jgi:3-oxoadipate enol-lactonase/4-carboxymuconolactone decarboxylase
VSLPRLISTHFGGPPNADLLLLGPSLGTSSTALWGAAAEQLAAHVRAVGWDLPGHGSNPPASSPFTIAELAAAVLALADDIEPDALFHYAGDSIGGAVGLQLLLDAPARVSSATLLCTAPVFGAPQSWHDRAALVRTSGMIAALELAHQRWFAPGFVERQPAKASALFDALRAADAESYALACEALAAFDVTSRLTAVANPVLAVAGAQDVATPPECLRTIAFGVKNGRLTVLDGVAHLAPAEAPGPVTDLIIEHLKS